MPDDFTDALDLVADTGSPVRFLQIEEVHTALPDNG